MAATDTRVVRERAEVHIVDAVNGGRQLQRHLDTLALYGVDAVQVGDEPELWALARGVLGYAIQQAEWLMNDLTMVREAFEEANPAD